MTTRLRALTLALTFGLACNSRRWRAPLSSLDGGARSHTTVSYGPPRPPNAVATVPILPGESTHCDTSADCPNHGLCFTPEVEARYSQSFHNCPDGQAWRNAHALHTCVHQQCATDGDCPRTQRCAETNMLPFPQRECLDAACRGFNECRAMRLGACVPYLAGIQCEHGGWACAYPTDECFPGDPTRRCASPRGQIAYCVPRNGRFRCVTDLPPPP